MLRRAILTVFGHQTLAFIRTDFHLLRVRLVNIFRGVKKKPSAMYLNIGCGPHGRPEPIWYNVDGWPATNIDALIDVRRPLPFADGQFKGIFCEHMFEHLTPRDARLFLSECLRVLSQGGTLRLSVPDGNIYLDKYFRDRDWLMERLNERRSWLPDWREVTSMDVVNSIFRQRYEHQYIYDAETLAAELAHAGFSQIERVDLGTGRDSTLLIDREDRHFESLYMEASA